MHDKTGNPEFDRWLDRSYRSKSGFDPTNLAPQFIPFFGSRTRIKVLTVYSNDEEYVRFGIVGVTTGRKPMFILMPRRTSTGSSDVLRSTDKIVSVKHHTSRHYVAVT